MSYTQSLVGLPATKAAPGTYPTTPGGTFGELLISELAPPYYALLKAGKVFTLAAAGQNPSAFVGGAAGTPLLGLYNPSNSGVDLVLLQARLGVRTTGTAASATDFNFWGVSQGGVAVTGTQTVARNNYSLAQSGSAAYGMVNTANTAALASALIAPSFSGGNITTTAGVDVISLLEDIKGAIVVAPGNYLAWGSAIAMTAASLDCALVWAELPA